MDKGNVRASYSLPLTNNPSFHPSKPSHNNSAKVIWERGRSLHRRKYKSARQNLCQFWALNTPKTRQRAYQYDESAIFRLIRQYINEIRYVKSFIRASPPDVGKPHIDDLFL